MSALPVSFRRRLALLLRAHHRPRSRDSERCFLFSCVRAEAGPRADCPFADRSGRLASAQRMRPIKLGFRPAFVIHDEASRAYCRMLMQRPRERPLSNRKSSGSDRPTGLLLTDRRADQLALVPWDPRQFRAGRVLAFHFGTPRTREVRQNTTLSSRAQSTAAFRPLRSRVNTLLRSARR